MIGKLVERDGVIVPNSARADFVAVAVEKGDGEFGLLQPIIVRGFPEGGDGERQHHDQAAHAKRQRLRRRLDEVPAPPARDMEAVHEYGETLIKLARPSLCLIQTEVDARIEIEKKAAQPCLPAVRVAAGVEEITQGALEAAAQPRRSGTAQPLLYVYPIMSSRSKGSKLWRDGHKMNGTSVVAG